MKTTKDFSFSIKANYSKHTGKWCCELKEDTSGVEETFFAYFETITECKKTINKKIKNLLKKV